MDGNGAATEVATKAKRRTFTAKYKRQILDEAERCTKLGDLGSLLRRHGLYSSHLSDWKRARDLGELAGLAPKKRGPKARPVDERDRRITELERELARANRRVEQAELIIEIQKKVSMILGIELPKTDEKPE
jgi:transposase